MNSIKLVLGLQAILVLMACENKEREQPLEQLDKKSSREVTLKTIAQGDSVLHITSQHIWYNGEQIASKSDTIVTAVFPTTWGGVDTTKTMAKVPIFVTVQ